MNSLIWTNPHEVDLADGKGVIYYIRVVDDQDREFRYIGRTTKARTRLQSYARNVKRIHEGKIRSITKGQETYRGAHLALAKAIEHGWEYNFFPLENAPVENLEMAEHGYINELRGNLNRRSFVGGLIGNWPVEDCADLVLSDFVESNTKYDSYYL